MHLIQLHPTPKPHREQRTLVDRLGLGPPVSRQYQRGPYKDRWSETLGLVHTATNGATTITYSRLIQQPFKIHHVTKIVGTAASALFYTTLGVSGELDLVTAVNNYGVPQITNVFTAADPVEIWQQHQPSIEIYPGLLYTAVPARIILIDLNLTGGDLPSSALVDVTYLAPNCPYDRPQA